MKGLCRICDMHPATHRATNLPGEQWPTCIPCARAASASGIVITCEPLGPER